MNNENSSDLKKRLLKNESDFVPIQQVTIPTQGNMLNDSLDYPEALPVIGNESQTSYGGKVFGSKKLKEQEEGTRKTNFNAMSLQLVKNKSKIFQMDIELKALDRQIQAYKHANNVKYYELTEKKMMILREYQVLVSEQNLIEREIRLGKKREKRRKELELEKEKKKSEKGKDSNMVNPDEKKKPKLVARGVDSYQVEKDRDIIVNPRVNTRYQSKNDNDCCNCDDDSCCNFLVVACYCCALILEAAG